VPAQAREEVLL